jgi:hypothetical protein
MGVRATAVKEARLARPSVCRVEARTILGIAAGVHGDLSEGEPVFNFSGHSLRDRLALGIAHTHSLLAESNDANAPALGLPSRHPREGDSPDFWRCRSYPMP